jgi:CRP-like cAMP-binding protein
MFDELFQHFESYTVVSPESKSELTKILEIRKHKSGELLCNIDDKPHKVYFILSGFARGFATSSKGSTYNRAIYAKGEFMASLASLIMKTKAQLALECLTECETIETEYDLFIKLSNLYPDIAKIYTKVLEENFIKLEQSNIQLATMSATERYLALRKRIPMIDNYISQYQIASHLGITPIQLSRIRKSILYLK